MKNLKRAFKLLSLAVVLFFGIPLGFMFWANDNFYAGEQKDCAVIFGAAVWRDDIPTDALNDRIQSGVQLYKNERVRCLVLSGGDSIIGTHEADVMVKEALKAGIPESAMITDYEGTSTFNTIKNLDPSKSYVLVSNDYHLGRINLFAWKKGLKDFNTHAAQELNGDYAKKKYYRWREVFGFWYYLFIPM